LKRWSEGLSLATGEASGNAKQTSDKYLTARTDYPADRTAAEIPGDTQRQRQLSGKLAGEK